MTRKDLYLVAAIGALVGILAQPIAANFIGSLHRIIPLPQGGIRFSLFALFLLLAPFALWIASLIGKKIPFVYQFAKFAAVGSLNSFVDLGVFNLETLLYGGLPGTALFAVFKAVSFLSATTNSYLWNKFWTFGASQSGGGAGEAMKFYGVAIVGGFLNVGVATFVRNMAPDGALENLWVNLVAPISGILSSFAWNFIGYKFFVFKDKTPATVS